MFVKEATTPTRNALARTLACTLHRTSARLNASERQTSRPSSFLLKRPHSFLMQRQCIRARKNKARDEARDKAQAEALATWSNTVRAIATVAAFVAPYSHPIDPRSAYTQAEYALVSSDGNIAATLRGLPVSVVRSLPDSTDGVPAAVPIALAPAVVLLSGSSNVYDANDALRASDMSPIAALNLIAQRARTVEKISVHIVKEGDVYYGEALLQKHVEGQREIKMRIAAGLLSSKEGSTLLQSSAETISSIQLWVATDNMMKMHIYHTYPACQFELIKVDGDCFFRSTAALLLHLLGVSISHAELRAVVAAVLSDAAAKGNEVYLTLAIRIGYISSAQPVPKPHWRSLKSSYITLPWFLKFTPQL